MSNENQETISELPRNCDRPECATTKAAQDARRLDEFGTTGRR